jgi:hypothetical protein
MKSLKRFPHFETVKPNLAQSDYVVPEVGVAGSVVQGTNQQRLEWPNEDWVVQPLTWRPRTLYLHGSGIVCDSHLKGEAADTNVSDRVFAYLSEAPFVPDRELKVILLGNGRSGKSSFANALKNQLFSKEEATTHGIKLWTIEDFPLLPTDDEDHSEGSKSVRLNIWDFAGQDLYHGTHRLFLQEKAIYIVCHSNPEYPGADEETDVFEKVAAESEKRITGAGDRPRRPVYWYQMIRSLLGSDRTEVRPQILFLHTKTDRAEEHSYLEDPPAGYSWHTFSAPGYVVAMQLRQKLDQGVSLDIALGQIAIEPGIRVQIAQVNDPKSWIEDQLENMELIKRWIQQQASRLLGNTESHQIPESAMKVKEAIRLKILENSAAYEKHENDRFNGTPYRKWGKATETLQYQSPHPKISRKEFDDLVAKHCGRWYMNRPELLLDWFHQSGFIYYDPKNLPNDILIDQRWAIHGIYTLFDRSGTPNLMDEVRRSGGQIPISALISRWEKHTTAYAAEDQKLFLQFMISCGMAYVVLTEEESLLNQKILAFPSLFPDKAEVWKVHKNRSVLRERFNIEIPDCSESEVRTVLARLGQRWSRRMEPYRWGCCRISPLVERSEFQLDWLEDPAESDCYVFPLHLSFLGEKDGVTESFVQETLFGVLGQSRGLTQEQLLATWPAEQRSEVQEGVLPKEVERNLQVGIAIAVSYAGPNRTRRSPSRILEDENYWLGEVPKRLCLKIRDAVRNGKQSAQGESIPGVSEIYFYDADDREERPEAMVASLTKGDLFIAFVSRKYLHSPYCMVEIYEVFRNNNRSLPNGKVLIIDVMLGGNAAVGGNFRRQRFRVSEWCQYWNRKWKVWFKVADYVATKKLSRKFKTASARTSKDQQAMEILSDPNLTFEIEKIRSAFLEEQHRSYSAWKDAIRVEQTKPILADLGSHIRENSVAISIDIPSGIFDFNDVEACNIIGGQVNIAFEAVKRLCEKAACGWSGFPQIPRR